MNAVREMRLFGSSDLGKIFSDAVLAELEAKLDQMEEREEASLMQKTAGKTYLDYLFLD